MRSLTAFVLGFSGMWYAAPAEAVTLQDAFEAAESQGPDHALLEERTRQTEALRGQAWSMLAPKLVAKGSYTLNEHEIALDTNSMIPEEFRDLVTPTDPIVVQPKDYWTGSLTVQQSLFSGETLPLLLGAYRTVDAARFDEQASQQKLRAGVAAAYYGLYTAREAETLSVAAEDTSRDQLELAKKQVAAETAPPRAILQAELALSQATREVQAARERRVQAEEAFHQLTALPRDVELELPDLVEVPASVDDAVASARIHRPDLGAADARAKAAAFQSRANWLGWAPDISARYTYAYTQNTGFSKDKTFWVVAVEGEWVLWDGGYRAGKAAEYAAVQHQAELYADKQVVVAEGEVRNAWEKYHRAQAALDAMEHEQTLADENLRLARLGFEAGNTTMLEVEQAELGQRAARLQALVERMNRDLAAIDLRVAVGEY